MSLLSFFTDPVLVAPTVGCMLMCLAAALVGVVVFLRKKSLLGEALSHASYPGVVLSAFVISYFFDAHYLPTGILIGAFLASLLGLFCIEKLEKFKVKSDAALCFVLSIFFGVGITFASHLQIVHPLSYQAVQIFLYGQAATMVDLHVWIYAFLCCAVILSLFFLYRPIEIMMFDRSFARSVGMSFALLDFLLFLLLVLAIIIGIRSVGVVLMVGMFIAPAVSARQFTHKLSWVFILSGAFGLICGFLGNYLSIQLPLWGALEVAGRPLVLPTGPMILLAASGVCFLSLCFAPRRGLVFRWIRALSFQQRCMGENLLKHLWKKGEGAIVFLEEVRPFKIAPYGCLFPLFQLLVFQGWIKRAERGYQLSSDGEKRAARIVRLHRLWEAYLVYLGQGREKVHRSAEEMEHILTPEIEKELITVLGDPKHDPHSQPIPAVRGLS